jgi:hypothetical protein
MNGLDFWLAFASLLCTHWIATVSVYAVVCLLLFTCIILILPVLQEVWKIRTQLYDFTRHLPGLPLSAQHCVVYRDTEIFLVDTNHVIRLLY